MQKMKCNICSKKIKRNLPTYKCKCGSKCHKTCCDLNTPTSPFTHMPIWLCSLCTSESLPFNHIIDDIEFRTTLHNFFSSNDHDVTMPHLNNTVMDVFQLNDIQ